MGDMGDRADTRRPTPIRIGTDLPGEGHRPLAIDFFDRHAIQSGTTRFLLDPQVPAHMEALWGIVAQQLSHGTRVIIADPFRELWDDGRLEARRDTVITHDLAEVVDRVGRYGDAACMVLRPERENYEDAVVSVIQSLVTADANSGTETVVLVAPGAFEAATYSPGEVVISQIHAGMRKSHGTSTCIWYMETGGHFCEASDDEQQMYCMKPLYDETHLHVAFAGALGADGFGRLAQDFGIGTLPALPADVDMLRREGWAVVIQRGLESGAWLVDTAACRDPEWPGGPAAEPSA